MPIDPSLMRVAEVVHLGTVAAGGGSAKNFANVYHFIRSSTVNPWSNTNIANEFIASILPDVCAVLNADYATTAVTARCVNDALDAPVSVADTTPGGVAGERLPDYNAVMLLLRTALRGGSYRGRKFYGPISEADSQDDVLTAGAVTAFGTLITTLLAGMTDSDGNVWSLAVFSSTLSQSTVNPTTIVANVVTQILLNKSLGTMRRRKVKTVR